MKSHARQQSTAGAPGTDNAASLHPDAGHRATIARLATVQSADEFTTSGPTDVGYDSGVRDTGRKSMRVWIIAALVLAAAVATWMVTRGPEVPAADLAAAAAAVPLELAQVDVASVQERVLARSLPLSGSMSPVVQATVKSKVSGEVEQVTVREGQDVRQGDVIARIDTRNVQAQYDRELAAVEKARADLDLATLNRDKNRSLLEQKYISQNLFEQTESAYAASVASFKLAEAQARMVKIDLDDAVVRAPFTGTIARRLVQPGEKVSQDSSIVTMVDLRQMLLEAGVPAAEIPSVRIGQSVRFNVGGFGERAFTGEVQRISPTTVEGSRSITIYIAVPNADSALKGGMFAQGQLVIDATQPVLSIPQMAAREEAGATFVYTLEDGKIVRKSVTLGPRVKGQDFVEVREGLTAGQRVIVADIGAAKPGARAFVRGEQVSEGA
ncbi:efflux RND transporter periplasmic adaptor subunit [Povalibacter sp.]|uniref:efflux RND transporter periplasmic adaptor subunit n=1 Tax=Povalibacter sp. TaxID=1962978 RepID=UPI002F3EF935